MAKKKREWVVTYLVTVTRRATVLAESVLEAKRKVCEGKVLDDAATNEFIQGVLSVTPCKPKRKETT